MTPQPTTEPAADFALAAADEALFWQQDKMHFPDPLAPMESAMIDSAIGHGFTHGIRAYDAPLERMEVRTINGYQYQAMVPMTGTPEHMAAQGALAEAAVRAALGRLDEIWSQEILPEVREHLGFWESFDLERATRAAFTAHVAETWARLQRMWELHFQIVLPAYLAISEFDELYRGLFPDAGSLDSYRLLEGLPNLTVEVGQALWTLSRRAATSREVRDVLASRPAAEVPAALYVTAAGRAFLAELEEYVERYGHRADKWTILAASWSEDPTPVIERLQEYVKQPDGDAPALATQVAAAARERAIAEARDRLRDYPAQIAGQFEGMLAAAQAGLVISEDHNYYIDMGSIHHLRAVLLEAGRRLVADGSIVAAEDVFMLTPDELQFALESAGTSMHDIVEQRLTAIAHQRTITPPPVLGTLPTAPPPDDPFTRFAMKFNGVPQAPENEREVRGSAGSSGIVRGTARVIRSISEAGRVQPGDIIVAETTAPPWTPLFATAGAVVTDTGGVLSHCAVVAREYGIPAVVGTGFATTVIADGMTIEVDGDAGIVRIV